LNDAPPRRIGLFGGSFDPVHLGHLLIAQCCLETLQLDQLRWLPNRLSPLKQDRPPAAPIHRLTMLELAVAGHPQMQIDRRELDRPGPSYTVDTLEELSQQQPEQQWYWLVGADCLGELPLWHRPERILELAQLVVVQRGGQPPIDWGILTRWLGPEQLAQTQSLSVHVPQIEISSSELRERVAGGLSLRYRVPAAVEQYIRQHQLYRGYPSISPAQ
jgi:nicotinate-nucleotide adenylyltransferase